MWQQYAKCFMQSENSDLKGFMIPLILKKSYGQRTGQMVVNW